MISNVIACAAWHGKARLLENVINRLGKSQIDYEAVEQADKHAKTPAPFKKELHRYTPFMLAVAKDDANLDCVKVLLKHGANFNCKDECGNTVLHVAALNGNNKTLDYLSKNLKINLFERNRNGETALNICQTLKNPEGVKCLEQYQVEYDKSRTQAEELLEELYKEEEHDEEARARRRQKKWRNKINKIAKAENITPEEVEERLQKEEERKKQEEAQKKQEELQREQ